MKKIILLFAFLISTFFIVAQSFEETVNISFDARENAIRVDINHGYDRDLTFDLYADDRYIGTYDMALDAVSLRLITDVTTYQMIFHSPIERESDFGLATVMDVDKFNINSVADLADFFKKTCEREEVLYYLIQNALFEKQCVCNQYSMMGPSSFYNLYINGTLDDYLQSHGCAANYGTSSGERKAKPSNQSVAVNTIENTMSIPLTDNAQYSYSIYDLTGQLVKGNICCSRDIDVSILSHGIYLMKVMNLDGEALSTYKFIK